MKDISSKIKTHRTAVARARISIAPETFQKINDHQIPKGDPLEVSKVAAIQAAKNTAGIIPYCHPVPIDFVDLEFELSETSIEITSTVKANYKTGVEMEALTAVSVAALTIYDMLKMLDNSLQIKDIELIKKSGGKSDFRQTIASQLKAAVVVMSDSISSGKKIDKSGRLIVDRLTMEGITVFDYQVIPDEPDIIRQVILHYTDKAALDLVITSGGTGLSPRDNTPELMHTLFEREIPGIAEAIRAYGQERTPYAMLSCSKAGVRGKTLIINLPGSTRGVQESLDAIFPAVLHSFKMLWGYGHPEKKEEVVTSS